MGAERREVALRAGTFLAAVFSAPSEAVAKLPGRGMVLCVATTSPKAERPNGMP
jgi:hypothetical protein